METLLETVELHGGFTINFKGQMLIGNTGYQVGITSLREVVLEGLTSGDFVELINDLLKQINVGEYLGAWLDNGKIYLDKSVHVADYKGAMKLAREREQLSIYDWAQNRCWDTEAE